MRTAIPPSGTAWLVLAAPASLRDEPNQPLGVGRVFWPGPALMRENCARCWSGEGSAEFRLRCFPGPAGADEVRAAFTDHHDSDIGIDRHVFRHDRGIGDAEA